MLDSCEATRDVQTAPTVAGLAARDNASLCGECVILSDYEARREEK